MIVFFSTKLRILSLVIYTAILVRSFAAAPERTTLTAAFFVGNVDAQLLRGEKKGNPYAGELQVIETYRQMQKQNPKLRIAEVERFVELQRRGELKRYVNSP